MKFLNVCFLFFYYLEGDVLGNLPKTPKRFFNPMTGKHFFLAVLFTIALHVREVLKGSQRHNTGLIIVGLIKCLYTVVT